MDREGIKQISLMDKTILIEENKNFGYAGEIWNSAYCLISLILSDKTKKLMKDKVVLEIGSGTGICGLFAALSGAKKVYLTDRESYLDILKTNYTLNKENIIINSCQISITPLDWNFPPHFKNINEKVDILIASDIIYHGVNYQKILELFKYFSELSKPEILLAYTDRGNSSAIDFFEILKEEKCWTIKKLNIDILKEEDEFFQTKSKFSVIYSIKYLSLNI